MITSSLYQRTISNADLAAANEYFAGQGSAPLPPSMGGELSEWNPHLTQCNGSGDDTADIAALLTSAENFSANTDRQRIPYPGVLQQPAEAQGYVNSNSWALSYLEYASITPVRTNVPGYDALAGNRIDPDYFTADPALADLTLENTDTDGDGILDVQDPEPLIPNRRPPPPQGP